MRGDGRILRTTKEREMVSEAFVMLRRVAPGECSRRAAWDTGREAVQRKTSGQLAMHENDLCRTSTGKPFVKTSLQDTQLDLRFSLAHADRMAAFALCMQGFELGVDVEPVERTPRSASTSNFCRRWLAPAEASALERGCVAFSALWVAKEAVAKASALGLSGLPPRSFSVWNTHRDCFLPEVLARSGPAAREPLALDVLLDPLHTHVVAVSWSGYRRDVLLYCSCLESNEQNASDGLSYVRHPLAGNSVNGVATNVRRMKSMHG